MPQMQIDIPSFRLEYREVPNEALLPIADDLLNDALQLSLKILNFIKKNNVYGTAYRDIPKSKITEKDASPDEEILKLLKELQRENGMGMIFITHDLGVVSEIADDVVVMNKGVIVERGKTRDILNNPQHPYTKGLIACRPPLDYRLERLPVVKEFLDGKWSDNNQVKNELLITDEERNKQHELLYSQEPILKVENLRTW